MDKESKVEKYFQRQAKELIELLFDKRFLNDDLSKDSIDWLEDYIGFIMQSQVNTAVKCSQLMAKFRDKSE